MMIDVIDGRLASIDTPVAVTDFTATATPTGLQTGDGCGTFAVNNAGKTTSASVQTDMTKVRECWGK